MKQSEKSRNKSYFLPVSCGRTFPTVHYAPKKIVHDRFEENTTPLALTLKTICPTMALINDELDQLIRKGEYVLWDDVNVIFLNSAKIALTDYLYHILRISSQTAVACGLTFIDSPKVGSIIYLWDAQLRIQRFQLTKILKSLHLPPFLASFSGPELKECDLVYVSGNPSLDSVVEDCVKRNIIFAAGDLISSTVRALFNTIFARKKIDFREVKFQSLLLLFSFLCPIGGCALGYTLGGSTGELIGEMFSYPARSYLTVLTYKLLEFNSPRKKEKPHRHRQVLHTVNSMRPEK